MLERREFGSDAERDPDLSRFPELDLLLACARWPQRRQADRDSIQKKAAVPIDWSLFLRLVRHHRLVPLVSHNLHAAFDGAASPDALPTLAELRNLAAQSAQQSLASLAELRNIVQRLHRANIPVRILKGLPLSQSIFGDLGLRPAGDIDLLIGEQSILEADHVLTECGYRPDPDLRMLSPRRLRFYRSHWKDVVYSNPATGSEVDLHWRCFRNRAMPGADLCAIRSSDTVCFGRFAVETLPRMENLLYLCVHGTLDGWLYLKSLVDVAAQVRSMPLAELDELARLATTHGVLPELTSTLLLVRRYLGMDRWSSLLLPPDHRTVRHILRYADRVLLDGGFLAQRDSIPIAATMLFELGLRRSLRYRFELLLRVLFRPRMWQTIPLPDVLFGMYPLLSPLEWLLHRSRQRVTNPARSPAD